MYINVPNFFTILRIVSIPLLIILLSYDQTLGAFIVFVFAAVTDALDGFFARCFKQKTTVGAYLDPIADKVLITVSFLCMAQVELIPWYLAIAVIARDLIIVAGALCYHFLIGPFEFAATNLSKANMCVQIAFCVLVLTAQVVPQIPGMAITVGSALVLFIAASSGFDYVMSWTIKAIRTRREQE